MTASSTLVPGKQVRDWKTRWEQIQLEYEALSAPCFEGMGGDSIHAWLHRLSSFWIQAYHLKDALKEAAPSIGMARSTIESAISNDMRLALLADLANLDKHFSLTNPPRSGIVPVVGRIAGVDAALGGGWLLSVEIQHGQRTLDGLQVANDAVEAWRDKLSMWGLL